MDEKVTTVVKINNVEYTIASSAPEEYVRSVSYYVDKKIQELTERDRRLSTSMAAVLACVNLADELFQARKQNEELTARNASLENEVRDARLLLDKKTAESTKLGNEVNALKINIAKMETELKHAKNDRK